MANSGPLQDQNVCQLHGCEEPAAMIVAAAGHDFAMCERHGRRLAAAVEDREPVHPHYELVVRYEREHDGSESAQILWLSGTSPD